MNPPSGHDPDARPPEEGGTAWAEPAPSVDRASVDRASVGPTPVGPTPVGQTPVGQTPVDRAAVVGPEPAAAPPMDDGETTSSPEGSPPEEWVRPPDPAWARPALLGLLAVTAVAYLWDLGRNGWGNTFYAAAVQSGTKSWSSFFFGSFDWGDYITVDKPPVSLWIMGLSGRIFGFSSWSMLAPEALLGVASVGLLYAAVRRVWGAPAGLLAGAFLALTPAAALMFRFNNPDAALTFLLVAAAYGLTRAVERASTRWLLLTAALIGTAFLAKSLQAFLVVPGMALAYLVVAPAGWGKRLWQLASAAGVLAVSALWWPLLVDALPAGDRPFIGGSTTNSVIQLALGYNGLNRITGGEGGGPGRGGPPGGGGGGGGGFGGAPGLTRLFNAEFGGFIAWLLPAALIGLVAGIWLTARARRTDPRWGSLILWGGWTLVTGGVLSSMSGIVHSYYTVALAPGVAALAAMVVPPLWSRRAQAPARIWLALMAAAVAVTAENLLGRAGTWYPWLRTVILVAGLLGALALLAPPAGGGRRDGRRRPLGAVGAAGAGVALAASVAGPLAWSAATIGTTHTGSIPGVGPAGAQNIGFGGFLRFRERDGGGGFYGPGFAGGAPFPGQAGGASGGPVDQAPGGGGQASGGGQVPGGGGPVPDTAGGYSRFGPGQGQFPEGFGAPPGAGSGGGLGAGGTGGRGPGEGTVNAALVALVRQGASGFTWAAAASSSQTAGPLQLAADVPVMSLGGFSGSDPAITLDRFKADVAAHKIHYYLAGGGFGGSFGNRGGPAGGPDGREVLSSITSWVTSTFTATSVGSTTVYDLSKPLAATSGAGA